MEFYLSKSRYCNAVQCPKMLWLKTNTPDVEESIADQSRLENGNKVGDLAMSLFGDYVEVAYDNDKSVMLRKTEDLIAKGVPVITEASFAYNGLFCSVDILKKSGDGYELYEVKSTTKIHEKNVIKKVYQDDIAYQNYVLTQCGIRVDRACLVYINNQYNYSGKLDLNQLFKIEDVTGIARGKMPEVAANIETFRNYMIQTEEPADNIGKHCNDPYYCGFWKYCTLHLPQPNIFDLGGKDFNINKKIKLYRQGIVSFDDLQKNDQISEKQRMKIEYQLYDLEPYADRENIKNFLNGLSYPLYFLDFETFQQAVPQYDNSRPYEQITFQYSLHSIEAPGAEVKHQEFLAYPGSDPRREVAESLCNTIPENACILAYNAGFEKERINRLAELYSDLAEHLTDLRDHIQDLIVPFSQGYYYNKAMLAGNSIKVVLPALFPDDPTLNYNNLEGVHNGTDASATFARMAEMSPDELEVSRKQLLEYCKLDTWAMVKIWEKLKEISQD